MAQPSLPNRTSFYVEINNIIVGDRVRKDLGNLDTLMESIKLVGLLHPIVVTEDFRLVAGYRRLEACKRLGWTRVPVNIVPLNALTLGEFHENLARKDFTVSEIVAIKRLLEPELKRKAAERVMRGVPSAESAQGATGKTRDIIAKYAGISHDTLKKAEVIFDASEMEPKKYGKLMEAVDAGKMSVNAAYKVVTNKIRKLKPTPAITVEIPSARKTGSNLASETGIRMPVVAGSAGPAGAMFQRKIEIEPTPLPFRFQMDASIPIFFDFVKAEGYGGDLGDLIKHCVLWYCENVLGFKLVMVRTMSWPMY